MALAKDETLANGSLRGATGPMAKVSWADVPQLTALYGSAASAANRQEQQDGSGATWALSTGGAIPGSGASLGTTVRCSRIGVRVRTNTPATQPPVDLIVDGRCVEAFSTTQPIVNGIASASFTDTETTAEFPHLLKLRRHTAFVHIDPNPDGATTNVLYVAGWLLPRADGFRDAAPAPRRSVAPSAVALTTSAALIGTGADTATAALHFLNTDTGAAHLVSIYREDGTTLYDTVSVPQAVSASQPGSRDYVFPADRNLSNYKFKADAASFVTMTPINR